MGPRRRLSTRVLASHILPMAALILALRPEGTEVVPSALALLLGVVFAVHSAGRVVEELARIGSGARNYAQGLLDRPVEIDGLSFESAQLAASIESMRRSLVRARERRHEEAITVSKRAATAMERLRDALEKAGSPSESGPLRAAEPYAPVVSSHRARALVEAERLGFEALGELCSLRAGAHRRRRTRVDIDGLIRRCLAELDPQASERGILLDFEADAGGGDAWVDGELLQRALRGLVLYALASSPAGSSVIVTCRAFARFDPMDDLEFEALKPTLPWISISIDDESLDSGDDREPSGGDLEGTKAEAGSPEAYTTVLELAREVAEVHGGDFRVETKDGQPGISRTLWLPIGRRLSAAVDPGSSPLRSVH